MLGKLMKYEFKAMGRIFLPLFGALLVVAAVNRLFISMNFTVPKIIGTSISVVMIVALCVIALILTLQRFYRNLLKSEGYLMLTLPVSTDSLIWSKLLVASIWTIVSLIVVMLAVSIMAVTGDSFRAFLNAVQTFFRCLWEGGFNAVFLTVETVVLAILSLFSGILMLYTCMALSLLVNKHRVGFSFLMYIVISIIGQIAASIIATTYNFPSFHNIVDLQTALGPIQSVFNLCFACILISGAVFYAVTRYMLRNKLNLE